MDFTFFCILKQQGFKLCSWRKGKTGLNRNHGALWHKHGLSRNQDSTYNMRYLRVSIQPLCGCRGWEGGEKGHYGVARKQQELWKSVCTVRKTLHMQIQQQKQNKPKNPFPSGGYESGAGTSFELLSFPSSAES